MKRKIFIMCIVGMFLASNLFYASAMNTTKTIDSKVETNDVYLEPDDAGHTTCTENEAYFGEVWSINKEKSFGAVNLRVDKEVYADWVAEHDKAHGKIKFLYAAFIPDTELSHYRLSTYRITIYDGPSTSDPVLLDEMKEVEKNKKCMRGTLEFDIAIPTYGEAKRDLAFVLSGETQLISNLLKIPLKEPRSGAGEKAEEGTFHVNFTTHPLGKEKPISLPKIQSCSLDSTINLDFGTILIYTEPGKPDNPRIYMDGMVKEYTFSVPLSEDVHVNAWINCSIDLLGTPHPLRILPFLTAKADFLLEGGYPIGIDELKTASTDRKVIPLTKDNLQWNATLYCNFTVNPEDMFDAYLVFSESCDLYWYPFPIWDIRIPPFRGDPHSSAICKVNFEYT